MTNSIEIREGTAAEFASLGQSDDFHPNTTYVATKNGEIVGHISSHIIRDAGEDRMHVHNLFTHPSERSQGIATALMQHVYAKAKEANLKKIICRIDEYNTAKFKQLIKKHNIKFKQIKEHYDSYAAETKPPAAISYEIEVA